MGEIDIWFSARLLIDCHGQRAKFEAARRLADFQERGDAEAALTWARIHQAIVLLTECPAQGRRCIGRPVNAGEVLDAANGFADLA